MGEQNSEDEAVDLDVLPPIVVPSSNQIQDQVQIDIDVNSSSGPEYVDVPGQVTSLSARSEITFGDHYHILEQNVLNQLTNDFVQFNGLRFDLKNNRADPQSVFEGQHFKPEQEQLREFMKTLQDQGMFEKPNKDGKIIYVED